MYLTVKEASELTGKSATTIYRLCNKRRNSLYIKKEDNKFFIKKEFLLATYPPEEKRISEEIEYGSVEIKEPVFLEIEHKKVEEVFFNDNVEAIQEKIELPESVGQNQNEEIPVISNFEEEKIIEKQVTIDTQTEEDVVFPQKSSNIERLVGVSISIAALIALLMLFYYYAK